jgi:hypothetical protein
VWYLNAQGWKTGQVPAATPAIPATQEAETGGLRFEASPSKLFSRPYLEKTYHKKEAGGVAQSVGPEFKRKYQKKKMWKTLLCTVLTVTVQALKENQAMLL